MSFTEDELQAFNSILERRFTTHRQEMEQALDQRLNVLRHEVDRRLASLHQEVVSGLKQFMTGDGIKSGIDISTKLDIQHAQIVRMFDQKTKQQQQYVEETVDRMLAAQLLGMEQLLNQHEPLHGLEAEALVQSLQPQLEAIEVQTELPWEDLAKVMGKALDERLASLTSSLQHSVANLEQYLMLYLQNLREELAHDQTPRQVYNSSLNGVSSVQEVLEGMTHLERVVESMQVAMTANHALLSNRLYHHQQLPLERAHSMNLSQVTQTNEPNSPLSQMKERVSRGQEAVLSSQPNKVQESEGQ
jgi:hypothetical protein